MTNRYEIHVISGLGGHLFARGTRALDNLLDELSRDWDAEHWLHHEWEELFDAILRRQIRWGDDPTVVLVGHSYGALRCQQIAVRLKTVGISVQYIAGIDPTALPIGHPPMYIPNNVDFVDEFWSTTGLFNFPLWRRRTDPDGSRGGKYVYDFDVFRGKKRVHVVPGGHIPCASDPKTVKIIMDKVRSLV